MLVIDGIKILIDDEDHVALAGLVPADAVWALDRDGYPFIAFRCPIWHTNISIKLHRWVMDAPSGIIVDHINGDRHDLRKSNLRFATVAQNTWNSRPKKTKTRSSKYKGVCKNASNKWQAGIKVNGKSKYLGQFVTEEQAAQAYDKAAKEAWGEFAYINLK